MDYLRIYNELIEHRKSAPVNGYSENHHIIPTCMGGENSSDNIVALTAREHYIAHQLLFKAHGTTKLAHAWFSMTRCGNGQSRFITARQYELARRAHVEALKTSMTGTGNHFYGRKHSDETKQKISEANKGNKRAQKDIDVFVAYSKLPKSEEHKAKIGRKGLVMLQNIDTLEIIRIPKEKANALDATMWVSPKKINPEKKFKCKHCDMVTVMGNLNRWHNDNCKHKL